MSEEASPSDPADIEREQQRLAVSLRQVADAIERMPLERTHDLVRLVGAVCGADLTQAQSDLTECEADPSTAAPGLGSVETTSPRHRRRSRLPPPTPTSRRSTRSAARSSSSAPRSTRQRVPERAPASERTGRTKPLMTGAERDCTVFKNRPTSADDRCVPIN
jgi:hypothetical protein